MGEGRSGGIVREPAIHRYALLYLKWIVNKDLLYSTGNAAQYTVKKKKKTNWEKKRYRYVYN